MDARLQSAFLQLLADGRSDARPMAYDDARPVLWSEFAALVQARRRAAGPRRRVLLAETSPLAFLAAFLAALADGDVPVIPPNFQPQTLQSFAALPAPADDLEPLRLELYTSGSSGEPKCIGKTLRQLEAECAVQTACWGEAAQGCVVVATTPHHHIYGLLFRLLWPLHAGLPFDTATIGEPTGLSERLSLFGQTVLVSSPAQLSRWPELADLAALANRPRLVFSSGGPLAADTAHHYAQAWGAAPVEIFGSTESGGIAWRRQSAGNAWTPLPDVQVAADADGALLVRSPFLPDATALRMEDAVELGEDGRFTLRGRLDRIVKIEEKRLSLPEMEAWLAQHPAVAAAAVAPVPVGRRTVVGAVIVAQGKPAPDRKMLVGALKAHLGQKYDDVLLPRRWRFVDRLPYSERGKLAIGDLVALLSTPL